MQGWVSVHRKMLDNPAVFKDADHIAVWVYLLLNAAYKEQSLLFGGKKITLLPGQLITGRKVISDRLKISDSKVHRILKLFETEQQIEQQTSNKNRLISIKNWNSYQFSEQQDEQQVNSKVNNKPSKTEQQSEQQTNIEKTANNAGFNGSNGQLMNNEVNSNTPKIEQQSEHNITIYNKQNNTLICAPVEARENESNLESKPGQISLPEKKTALEQDQEDFEKIYAIYPKKRGKNKAFEYYRGFVGKGRTLNGIRYRLDRKQIYLAVAAYVEAKEEAGTDLQFYQDFSTFMNKTILDYLPEKEDKT